MKRPLVSIFVITYNSSSYIKETLDSTLNQTYPNIELIISDDCSTDNTVEICGTWLKENGNKFKRTKLVVAPQNRGVAPNCNQAITEAKGQWLKGLSGDDKLLPNSIQDYVDYVSNHPDCDIVFGKLLFYGYNGELVNKIKKSYETDLYPLIKQDVRKQYRSILKRMFVPGPGLFFKKSLWQEIGGMDIRYPMADEYPFTFQILKRGHRIHFLDKETYGYNVHEDSLCHNENNISRTKRQGQLHFYDERWKELLKKGMILELIDQFIDIKISENEIYNRLKIKKFIINNLVYLSPLRYIRKLKYILKIKA